MKGANWICATPPREAVSALFREDAATTSAVQAKRLAAAIVASTKPNDP
jgi:hypothetical protein